METATKAVIQLRIDLKTFNSIEEVMSYPDLKSLIDKEINEIRKQYLLRPEPPAGRRYVRTAVDQMRDADEFNTEFMIEYYSHVYNKVSSIPSAKREVMKYVCGRAIDNLIRSLIVNIKQGDKLHVQDSKAKMTILELNKVNNTVKVEFKKIREDWPIKRLVDDIKAGTLIKM